MKKILLIIPFLLFVSLPVKADDGDTWIPQSQIDLCESLGAEYGICQINGAVWGYEYDTEEKQIRKACEMLLGYECEVDEALARYQGQRNPKYEGYVEKVLTRSHELEVIHGK